MGMRKDTPDDVMRGLIVKPNVRASVVRSSGSGGSTARAWFDSRSSLGNFSATGMEANQVAYITPDGDLPSGWVWNDAFHRLDFTNVPPEKSLLLRVEVLVNFADIRQNDGTFPPPFASVDLANGPAGWPTLGWPQDAPDQYMSTGCFHILNQEAYNGVRDTSSVSVTVLCPARNFHPYAYMPVNAEASGTWDIYMTLTHIPISRIA